MRAGPAVLDLCEVFPLQMPDLPEHIEDVVSSWGGAPQRRLPTYTTHPHSPVFPVPAGRERGWGWCSLMEGKNVMECKDLGYY